MEPVMWYALIVIAAVWYLRRIVRSRSVTHYTPAQVSEKLKNDKTALLLDVRTDAERKESFIKGSLHIPLHLLRSKAGELQRFKAREIICYCRSGNRSVSAALILKKSGFTAASMRGGLVEWNFSSR